MPAREGASREVPSRGAAPHPGLPDAAEDVRSTAYDVGPVPGTTVVVSTHDRVAFLPGLFDALERQRLGSEPFELVVVDDASTDTTWPALVDYAAHTPLRFRALRLGRNVGQGVGRAVGTAAARGDVVAFTDDDCLPTDRWLERLLAPFEPGPLGEPRPVVVQGETHGWPDDLAEAGPWSRTVWVMRPTWLFETCNIAYRRCDLERVGGFPTRDEAHVAATGRLVGEDAITGWRVTGSGVPLVFAPDALVHHRHLPGSYAQWLREQTGRGAFPALVKRSPLGAKVLWRGLFLAPRTAAFDLAVACVVAAAATRRPRLLVGALAWVWMAMPEARDRRGRHPVVRVAQIGAGDFVGMVSLIVGSVRSGRIVL